jgi:hypothetical protein
MSDRAQLRRALLGTAMNAIVAARACRVCGCTDTDCSRCIARTGQPCHWVAPRLCSACVAGAFQ